MALPRVGLTTRIFATSAVIVVLVLAIALALIQRSAQNAAQISLATGLASAQQSVLATLSRESGVLQGKLLAYAENSVYRASIEAREPEYLDYTQTAVEQIDARWVQLVSREGVRLAKSDEPAAGPDTLLASPLVRGALDGEAKSGFGVTADSVLIQLVAVPVQSAGNRIIGGLMAARTVTDSLVRAAGTETQSQLLFYTLDREGEPRASSGTDWSRNAFTPLLEIAAASIAGEYADTAATSQLVFNGGHFVVRHAVVRSASGSPVGGFLVVRSLDDQLRAAGFADLTKTGLLSGAIGLVLALVISGVMARQIVRPVTTLADATRRAAEGDYAAVIPEGGSGEISTLSSAFRRLLADLKDKQALVDFLGASAAGARTQALAAAAAGGPDATLKIPAGMANMTVLAPGKMLGTRYEIKSVLGVGGMGMVYKANDRELGEVLAIKTLKPEMVSADPNALERFKSEIKLARKIAHRNVVRTYDLGEISGVYYISMEYVEGKSLKDLIRERGRLPASIVMPIAKQLCRALEVSHDEGVIHRDIKPQNMVVQSDGVLKVMDFGIARLATRPKESGHTEAGMVVGTPEYMAPEQLLGDELDARADLYSTGAVLYECLTGRVPITADTPIVLISRVLEEIPKSPREVFADVPPGLSDLVMSVLQKDREKRPRSAAELHKLLDAIELPRMSGAAQTA
jgi:HAMP domain-containing protein/predicted Ser/Thr protein kinase